MASTSVLPIVAKDISLRRNDRQLLDIEALTFERAGCCAIIGPNGAGKSLLIRTLAGLQKPDSGQVTWGAAVPSAETQMKVGLLLQRPVLLSRSALANVLYPLTAAGVSKPEAIRRAMLALDQAGLANLANTHAGVLSGGEQQRLALARALSVRPEILFLDEPTANVDPTSTLPIEAMLHDAMGAGTCLVLVSHDLGQVRRLADEVILLHHGRIVERSFKDAFYEQPSTAAGRAFLNGEILT